MSSEDQSVNPSEQGPSPPQSSAGATPSGSPTPTERRVRGRTHRDSTSSAHTPRPTHRYVHVKLRILCSDWLGLHTQLLLGAGLKVIKVNKQKTPKCLNYKTYNVASRVARVADLNTWNISISSEVLEVL